MSGPLAFTDVMCDEPSLSGNEIVGIAKNSTPGLLISLTVANGSVTVMLKSGAGSTYVERDFSGSGVSGFDASSGAQINSPLTDSTTSGGKKGSIGAVTSISGSFSCAGQTPGSGSFTLSGSVVGGALGATLNATRVECTTSSTGTTDHAVGVGSVGSTPALIAIFASTYSGTTYISMTVSPQGSATAIFLASAPGSGTVDVSASSMHVSGVVTTPSGPKDTVQLMGSAACGSGVATG